jgi:hypothetical protein
LLRLNRDGYGSRIRGGKEDDVRRYADVFAVTPTVVITPHSDSAPASPVAAATAAAAVVWADSAVRIAAAATATVIGG